MVGRPSPPPMFPERRQTHPVTRACPPAPTHTQLPSTALPKAPGQWPPWTGTAAWPLCPLPPAGPLAQLSTLGAHTLDLLLWVKPPSGLGGTQGERPGRLRSDHLTPTQAGTGISTKGTNQGRRAGSVVSFGGRAAVRALPPHSHPKVPLTGLAPDFLSEGLSHPCGSPHPTPEVRGPVAHRTRESGFRRRR